MNVPIDPEYPLARFIDQTLLRPAATVDEVIAAAESAAGHGFAAFCVAPCYVKDVAPILRGSTVAVDTVIGFPLGFQTTTVKLFEAEEAVRLGAEEIDLVCNRGWVRSGRDEFVEIELRTIAEAVSPVPLKVILETSDLTPEEVLRVCEIAARAGPEFVKTSTGFFGAGAELDTVRAIKDRMGSLVKVKASGGIRDLKTAWAFIQAGAHRIGTSSGMEIMKEFSLLK
ncbi:MAG: deoxyribose-phosphate aldolase [Proteobacteria bacterium]|nr:deoxyribose-phosphate aldolase [Pseudomonadota bacterium]